MAQESTKTKNIRQEDFIEKYLKGSVIDIGSGDDLVVDSAEPFDLEQGDANSILRYKQPETYDCVYSSHTLEHMVNIRKTLLDWWRLIKPGGYMVVIVPDEDLYEQGVWPSIFNTDHKATFTLKYCKSWSPVSYNLLELFSNLLECRIISSAVHDANYDYALIPPKISRLSKIMGILCRDIRYFLHRMGQIDRSIDKNIIRLFSNFGAPIDQTIGSALAQLEIVAQKKSRKLMV